MAAESGRSGQSRYLVWIDGVGTFLLCLKDRVTIGAASFSGGTPEEGAADVALLANISRQHASIQRSGDGYLINAHAATAVGGRPVQDRTHLNDGYEIELAQSVKLRFRLPTALSASARLEFLSDHRPAHSVDGVVLMDDTCLLGPSGENHIQCLDWPGTVLLFRKDGQIWCKSRLDVFVADRHITEGVPLNSGDIVSGTDLRFRIEAVD